MQTQVLSTKELAAGAKAFVKEALDLQVGANEIDVTVRIVGTANKGEDYMGTVWTAAKPEQILRLLVAYSGAVRDTVAAAIASGDIAERLAALPEERDEMVEEFISIARVNAVRNHSGKTTFPAIRAEVLS
jgi:hypothetical protein